MTCVIACFTFRIYRHGTVEVLPALEQFTHTRPLTAALLSLSVADNLSTEQANGALLELLAAAAALLGVVLLDECVEVGRKRRQMEGEVGRQKMHH